MKTKTIPNDHLSQACERAMQEPYEKFKRESFEHLCKQREAKQRRDIEASAEMPRPAESADK